MVAALQITIICKWAWLTVQNPFLLYQAKTSPCNNLTSTIIVSSSRFLRFRKLILYQLWQGMQPRKLNILAQFNLCSRNMYLHYLEIMHQITQPKEAALPSIHHPGRISTCQLMLLINQFEELMVDIPCTIWQANTSKKKLKILRK